MNHERAPVLAAIGAVAVLLAGLTLPAVAIGASDGQSSEAVLGGKRLVGQVRNVYVRVADSVLLDAAHAPATMIARDAVQVIDVEFQELLPDGSEAIRAQLIDVSDVQVGDIVEVKFAHKDNPRFFPVNEVTRVTELVARRDTALARYVARNIMRARHGVSPLQAMLQPKPGKGGLTE